MLNLLVNAIGRFHIRHMTDLWYDNRVGVRDTLLQNSGNRVKIGQVALTDDDARGNRNLIEPLNIGGINAAVAIPVDPVPAGVVHNHLL